MRERDAYAAASAPAAGLRFGDWPIAVKLIALTVACAVLLAAGLTTLAYTKASAGLTTLAEAGLGSDAQLTADAVDQWNTQLLSSLTIEAQQPALVGVLQNGGAAAPDASMRRAQQVLSILAHASPDTDSIALLGLNGDIVLSSNPIDLGTNVRQRDYFTEAAAGRPFISGVSISTITHAPVIFHSAPVREPDGHVLGVLRSRSSLDAVSQAVRAAAGRVGAGAQGVLLDQQGLVITSADPTWTLHPVVPLSAAARDSLLSDKRWGGSPVPDALGQPDLATALTPGSHTVFEWTNAGQLSHSIAVPLKQTRWTYVLGVPATTFNASVTDFLQSALVAALAGVLLISGVGFLTGRRIAKSVSQVAAAARQIATEDLSSLESVAQALAAGDLTRDVRITAQPLEVRSRDEMGAMARDFNAMIGRLLATGAAFKHMSANLRELIGQVQASATRFEALVQNAADVILIQTADGIVTYASPATLPAWGRLPETVVGCAVLEALAHPDDRESAHTFLTQVKCTDSSVSAELRMAHVDGSWREMEIIGTNLLDHLAVGGLVLTCRDVTQHKTLERQLRRESDRMLALHRASTALAGPSPDTDAALNEVLRNAISLIGCSSGSLHRWDAEAGVLRAVGNRDVNERHATPDIRPGQGIVGQTFSRRETLIVNDYRAWEHARGPARGGNLTAGLGVPLIRDGKCIGVLTLRVYGDDPTRFSEDDGRIAALFARQAAEALFSADAFEEQRRAALHDALTGLPNRLSLQNELQTAVEDLNLGRSRSFALMILDLDRFKEVNDTLGHQVGDVLLQQLGDALGRAVRATDLVARLGGDEFAVLLPNTDAAGAAVVARNLVNVLQTPFLLDGHPIAVDASVGIAIAPEHGQDADTLMRCADIAMYQAKRSGDGVAQYSATEDVHRPDRLALLGELRTAIDNNELLLHYQPKLDLRDGSLVGVEALVRWQHPQRGFLPPMEFIPLAEQTGLIYPLSQWVLEAALKQHQAWARMGIDIPVAVNLSRRTLHDPQMPEMVAELLTRWNVAPGALVLEITESSLMADPERANENLTQLRERGVRIAIDDFGTGYSSLASLKNLSVDELKIDRSFVKAMASDASSRAIVQAVIDLADALKLHVVAEGVEDRDTWDVLAALGCEVAQGYFLSRPVAASDLQTWMAQVAPAWLAPADSEDVISALRERSRERESRLTAEAEFIARKQAESALRASEERYRLALQAASMGTWDIVGEVNTWSPETEALYGLEPGTYEGTFAAFRRLMHPDDWPAFRAEIKASLAERRDSYATYRTVWPDGSVHWLESKGRALFGPDGEVVRVTGTTMDITERKLAEAALRTSEDRLRRSYKGFPLPTYSWVQVGDDFVLEDFNDAAEVVTDGVVREWLGNRASEQFADQPEMLASLRRCVQEQRTVRRVQHYADPTSEMGRDLASTYVFVPPRMVMAHIEDITAITQGERTTPVVSRGEQQITVFTTDGTVQAKVA